MQGPELLAVSGINANFFSKNEFKSSVNIFIVTSSIPSAHRFCFEFVICIDAPIVSDIHTKKAWHFFAFIGCSEVLDYLQSPNYNEQSPRHLAGASLLYSGKLFESVQVSEQPAKLLRFFLFYDVHIA